MLTYISRSYQNFLPRHTVAVAERQSNPSNRSRVGADKSRVIMASLQLAAGMFHKRTLFSTPRGQNAPGTNKLHSSSFSYLFLSLLLALVRALSLSLSHSHFIISLSSISPTFFFLSAAALPSSRSDFAAFFFLLPLIQCLRTRAHRGLLPFRYSLCHAQLQSLLCNSIYFAPVSRVYDILRI